jgi:hypothetical protein
MIRSKSQTIAGDAMERDFPTTIATKADLQLLRYELSSQMASAAIREEVQACRFEMALLRKDLELMSITVTARFSCMLFVAVSLFFIAMKVTS